MIDLGTVKPGSTIRIPFSSFDKDDGSSITMTNYAAADILIYKDGSTTERASTAGFTATTDFDAKTGKHLAVIDLSDNTTAGFYSAGSEYLVAIDAVTVDAVTTGGWIARFRIGIDGAFHNTTIATLSSQTSFTLTDGPAEDSALKDCIVYIHDVASAVQGGYAVVSAYTGSTKTVTLTAGTTYTAAATDNISFFPPVNMKYIAATAQTARDIGASVLLSSGTGTGQLDFTSGVPKANVTQFNGSNATSASGRPEVNATHWNGTAVATPNTAGVPVVDTRQLIRQGTAQSTGNSTTAIKLDSSASATTDFYKTMLIQVISGTGAPEAAICTAYDGSTKIATVAPAWPTAPDNTSIFQIFPAVTDVEIWKGSAVASPATAGIPDVNAKNINNVSTSSVTTINANQGTTQPVNFTGTGASALAKSDMVDIAGAAVSTSTAQIGVNAVQAGGTAWGSGAITAASIAADAITAAKIADGAIDAATFAAGAINAAAIASDAITAAKIADGAIDAATFATGAINAAAIAADAIGASELAADAVTEIRALASGTSDSGTTTTMVDAARTEADTDYWDENHLIVFTSGNIAGQARVITGFDPATDTITFTPATTQAVSTQNYEIWPAVSALRPTVHGRTLDVSAGGEAGLDWANIGSPTTAQSLSGTSTKALEPTTAGRTLDVTATGEAGIDWNNIGAPTTTVNLSGTTVKTATDVEADTQDIQGRLPAALTGGGNIKADALAVSGDTTAADNLEAEYDGTGFKSYLRRGTAQAGGASTITLDSGASATDDYYNNQIVGIISGTGAGQGMIISDYVGSTKVATVNGTWATNPDNTSVFVILPFGSVPGASAPTAAQVADAVWDETLADHLTSGSTGAGLNAAGSAGDPWATALPGSYGAGTAGKIVGDNVNATISSRLASASITLSGGAVTVGTNNDKTGYGLSSAAVQAIWDALTSALTTSGSIGKLLVDNINAALNTLATSSALTTVSNKLGSWTGSGRNTILGTFQALFRKDSDATVPSDVNANLGGGAGAANNTTDSLEALADELTIIDDFVDTEVAAILAAVDTEVAAILAAVDTETTAASIAAAVWDAARSGHVSAGTFGEGVASVQGNLTGSIGSLATQAKADVNAEVVDVIRTDTATELSAIPGASPNLHAMMQLVYMSVRNAFTNTATAQAIKNDAGTTIGTNTVSDDGTTYVKGKFS